MYFRYIVFIIIVTLITSCDCSINEQGYVLDSTTGDPISGAQITFNKRTYQTDNNGYFKIKDVTGFCPERHFIIEKRAYKRFEILIKTKDDWTNYSVLNKSEFKKFDTVNNIDTAVNSGVIGKWVYLNSKNFAIKDDTLIIKLDKE